ncbi:MAG: O-antigen ligase family protein [Rhodoferax sp.]|uniref:O-antigen ligase family protein n=1 Tax=Rhodoferax sp. TaxID=50421 RepID=UPI003266BB6B
MEEKISLPQKYSVFHIVDALVPSFLALAPLCLLSIRGWTNIFFFLLLLCSFIQLARTPSSFSLQGEGRTARWIMAAMASPLLAVIAAQLLRGQLQLTLMDGPSRPFLAIVLFIYLLHTPIDFVRLLEWCIPFSLLILACFLWVHPYGFINIETERFGTTAIDPLTLGQYATLFGLICLFTFNIYGKDNTILKILKITGIAISIWISIGTGSRSGWVALPVLLILWLLVIHRAHNSKKLFLTLFGFIIFGIATYQFIPTVHDRISSVRSEYTAYISGGKLDTSTGLRISLARVAGTLFLEHPFAGYGDMHYPALSNISAISPFYTAQLEDTFVRAGVHNEILQNALRSGIFGIFSGILMFAVPGIVFFRGSYSIAPQKRAAGLVGLCYIVAVFCFSLSTETFNLKYTVSFYALMVSALAAQVLRPQPV